MRGRLMVGKILKEHFRNGKIKVSEDIIEKVALSDKCSKSTTGWSMRSFTSQKLSFPRINMKKN